VGDEGVLSMYGNGRWMDVCGDYINQTEVDVICHQLGYITGEQRMPYTTPNSMNNTMTISLDVNCTGNEYYLKHCLNNTDDIEVITDCLSLTAIRCQGSPVSPCSPISLDNATCSSIGLQIPPVNVGLDIFLSWDDQESKRSILLPSNTSNITIYELQPSTVYRFSLITRNSFGNSSPSDLLIINTNPIELPTVEVVGVALSAMDDLIVHWRIKSYLCDDIDVVSFDILLNDSSSTELSIYNTNYNIQRDTNYSYIIARRRLQSNANYFIYLRAVCASPQEDSLLLYGSLSHPVNFSYSVVNHNTLTDNDILTSPYFSLVVLTLLVILSLLFIMACCLLMICVSVILCQPRKKTGNVGVIQSLLANNIYAAGEPADQSYIPMHSSTVNAPKRQKTNSSIVSGYWIDAPEASTFRDSKHVTDGPPVKAMEDEEEGEYDEIPINIDDITSANEDEEEEKVYDEITEISANISNDEDNADVNLPSPSRTPTLSQEAANEITIVPVLPPPKEFAGIPQRKFGTISGSQAKSYQIHYSRHLSDYGTGPWLKSATSTLVLNREADGDDQRSLRKASSIPRLNMIISQEEDDSYYSIPPRATYTYSKRNREEERSKYHSSSPEYEILVHPKSTSHVTNTVRRGYRTPPPVPARPISRSKTSLNNH
jgi:hypothetical protein